MKRSIIITLFLISLNMFGFKRITISNETNRYIQLAEYRNHLTFYHEFDVKPYEKISIGVNSPVVAWFYDGVRDFTVLRDNETHLSFIENNGTIKVIRGGITTFKLTNSHNVVARVHTINPHEGEIYCEDCIRNCYDEYGSLVYCRCLAYCHDRSRDLTWRLFPREQRQVTAGSERNVRVIVDEEQETPEIQRRTTYYFY